MFQPIVRASFLGIIPALVSCGFGISASFNVPCGSNPEADLLCKYQDVPSPKLYEEINELPLERQYKVHRLMMTKIRPPYAGARESLLARGKPALDYALDRAGESHRKDEMRDACSISHSMALRDIYPVCEDQEVMDQIGVLSDRINSPPGLMGNSCSRFVSFCERKMRR